MAISITMPDTSLPDLECRSQADEAGALAPMDEEAFRAFYDRTARPVWAYLSRLTGDPHLADDFLQEAYYRFYRSGSTHQSEAHRRNLLYRIATNIARDHSRRQRRHYDVPLPEETNELRSEPVAADRAEHRTDLGRAMARLKPEQREMLWLAYAQGSSHDEIAEVLGVKSGNVKTLLYRARRKLADLLRGEAPEDRP
jgi:RNA polymerase sigma-70 factor (ECF subfamily)